LTRAARFLFESPVRFLIVACALVVPLASLSRPPAAPTRGEHLGPVLPQRQFLEVIGAPFPQLMADYYWIQTIQAVGRARYAEEYVDAYYFANLLTDLDPGFHAAYSFAGAAVPYNRGRETWVNTELSTRLLEKGRSVFPGDLSLNVLLAYNLSYFHGEYRRAADVLSAASQLPGAPSYLSALATRLYAQSGSFDSGLALAESLRDSARDQETRAFFDRRVKEIALERELSRVEEAWRGFNRRRGRGASISELVASGDLDGLPSDPLGGVIVVDENGRASSTSQERRLEIHRVRLEGS
jgi:hypothetical protein